MLSNKVIEIEVITLTVNKGTNDMIVESILHLRLTKGNLKKTTTTELNLLDLQCTYIKLIITLKIFVSSKVKPRFAPIILAVDKSKKSRVRSRNVQGPKRLKFLQAKRQNTVVTIGWTHFT